MSKEKKQYIDKNLCFYYGLSDHKIGKCPKYQQLPPLGKLKTRKAEVISFKKLEN